MGRGLAHGHGARGGGDHDGIGRRVDGHDGIRALELDGAELLERGEPDAIDGRVPRGKHGVGPLQRDFRSAFDEEYPARGEAVLDVCQLGVHVHVGVGALDLLEELSNGCRVDRRHLVCGLVGDAAERAHSTSGNS